MPCMYWISKKKFPEGFCLLIPIFLKWFSHNLDSCKSGGFVQLNFIRNFYSLAH